MFVKDLTSWNGGAAGPICANPPLSISGRLMADSSSSARSARPSTPMPLTGDRTPRLLVDTPFIEDEVHVSPDGRWVAFNTNESGRWEVYVAAFPTFTAKRQLSSGGGVQPQWRADSRELFYLAPDGSMMSVRVDPRAELTVSPPSRLFPTTIAPDA